MSGAIVEDVLQEAERRRQLGVEATANGLPEQGAGHLESALGTLGGDQTPAAALLRAKVLIALAMCEFERHGLAACTAALERAEQAADVLRPAAGRSEVVALCHSQRANALGRSGRLDEALGELDHALQHLEALQPRDRWVILLNRGMARGQRGDLAAAETDLAAAAAEAERAGLVAERFVTAHDQGWLAYLGGDLPRALGLMEQAAETAPDVADGMAMLDRGRVLLEAGLLDDAAPMLQQAVDACAGNRQGHSLVEATYELARAELLRGESGHALELAERAQRLALDRGAIGWAARASLVRLRLQLRSPSVVAPTAAAVEARKIALDPNIDPLVRHSSLVVQAEALTHTGDLTQARRALHQADLTLGTPRPLHLGARLERMRVEALAAAGADQYDEVDQVLRGAANELLSGVTASSLDLLTARSVHGTALAAMDVGLALQSGPEALLLASERWRLAIGRRTTARPHPSPLVAQRLAEVRRLSEAARADRDAVTLADLAEAERRAAAAIRGLDPAAAADHLVGPEERGDLDLGEVTAALAEDGCDLLTTVAHEGIVWGVGIVDGASHQQVLGEESVLAEASRRARKELALLGRFAAGHAPAAIGVSLEHGVDQLRRILLESFCPQVQRLVVVPGRAVAGLPWSMIASGRGACVSPSVTQWLRSREPDSTRRERRTRVLVGPRLRDAAAEAAAVRDIWGSGSPAGAGDGLSTIADLHAALRRDDLVHVAAHGRHHMQNPMFSSIALTDGPSFLYDLETGDIQAGHVVLAACDVGRSAIRPGDVPLGLAAGLLSLGVRSVLAATCAVPDDVALATMPDYHARLAAGTPSDVALADVLVTAPQAAGAFTMSGAPWIAAACRPVR